MAPSRDDLDWLYRDDDNVDPTQQLSAQTPQDPAAPVNPPRRGRQSFVEEPAATRVQPVAPAPPVRPRSDVRPVPAPGKGGTPPPQQPPRAPRTRKRRRRPVRRFFTFLLVLVLVLGGYLIGVPLVAWTNTAKIDAFSDGPRPAAQPGKTYLLVGSDSREGLSAEDQRRLGTGGTEGQRADTMMLLHIPATGEPALISLPRDSFVDIPGHGQNKLNAAYAFGGPQLLVATVEQATGVRVDEYLEVGFGGFVNVIDALGGIEMCLDEPIQDRDSHLDLPAGCQVLDGPNALGYVRMRKADPRGDLGRIERQREMLGAIASKAASPWNVIIPTRYWELSNAAASSVAVHRRTGLVDTAQMGQAFLNVSRGRGLTLTVPVANANASTSVGSAVLWDESGAQEMFGQIARGSTEGLEKFARQ